MKIKEITDYLNHLGIRYSFYGDLDFEIITFCPLKEIQPHAITWVRNLSEDLCCKLTMQDDLLVVLPFNNTNYALTCHTILVENPHRTFFKIIEHFFYKPTNINRHSNAIIETTDIGQNLSIGAFSYIGPDVKIGNNCIIGNHVTIEGNVIIGNNVILDSGVRIGTWGFGHYLNDDNTSTMIPHIGGVTIGDHVFIGAETVVARGTLSNTIIGNHVKIDAQCCICHNAEVEDRVIITGGVGVAGSALIKKDCWLAPRCVINASVTVGENAFIGINSVVTKDIPSNQYAFGIPAKVIRENTDTKYKI